MTTRQDVVDFARPLAGLSADPACHVKRAMYIALVAPGETEARGAEMATMSGCELLALRGILGAFIDHPLIANQYRDRKAGEDLLQVGREAHAVRLAGELPQLGDILIVGGGEDGGGSEHAWTLVGEGEGIDGGQRDAKGFESIALRQHEIQNGWDVTSTYRRKIRFLLNTGAILERFGR